MKPLVLPVALLALAGAPPSFAGDPLVDEGDRPARAEARGPSITVEVSGFGPTAEDAVRDAQRARDAALAAAIPGLRPAQLQAPAGQGPTSWPGGETLAESVAPENGGFRAHLAYRLADAALVREVRVLEGLAFAHRVLPRSGFVLVEPPVRWMEGLRQGDVVLGHDGWDGLAEALRDERPVDVERGGAVERVVVRHVPQAMEPPNRRLAPTCGPCCHHPESCDPSRGWQP